MAAVFDPSKPYQTVVDKEFAAFTAPKTSASKPEAPTFDPNQPYEVVPEAKPVAPVSGGAPKFNPDADFDKLYSLDEVKTKPEKELDEDKAFHPVEFGLQNQQALQNDPEALDKLTRIYKARETRGTTLAEKGAALVKGTPTVAKAIGKGVATTAKAAYGLNPVALLARAAGAATVPGGLDIEAKRVAGEVGEIPASIEAAAAGSGDLLRRGGREIKEGAAGLVGGGKAALSEQDWRNRLFMDISGLEQSQKAGQGNGEILKALGNDAETLKQSGIELRPEVIQELSVVTDPINWIPIGGAVAGVTKIGGKLTTRIVATALTAEEAAKLAQVLNLAGKIATIASEKTPEIAQKITETVGKGVESLGTKTKELTEPLVTTGGVAGGVSHGLGSGLKVAALLKYGPGAIEKVGRGIQKAAGAVPAATRIAGQGLLGTGEGLLLSLPFELGARPEEEEQVLGAAGVAGATRAGIKTFKEVGAKAQDALAKQIFKQVEQAEAPPSATYGTEPTLDTANQAVSARLQPNSLKLLNWTRELFRDSGVEAYSLDNKTFENEAGTGNAHGYAIKIGEKVAQDGTVTPVIRILLNADTEALPHELFHALTHLDPKGAKGLIDSILESWTPEQKQVFSDIYNTARNGGRPKSAWTTQLTDEGVGNEAGAEVFSRLFLGQDLSGVAPGIKQKAALFLSGILEKLGVPLGKVDAERGAPGVSTLGVRPGVEPTRVGQEWIQNLLSRIRENGNILPEEPITSPLAGGEIVPGEISRRPADQVPPTPTAPVPQPVPKVTPAAPVPTPARNIRVTREQQNDFAARRAADLGIDRARAAASTPEATQRVNEVSASMEAGNPVLEIDHRGVIAEGTEKAPSGRTARRAEQEAAYIAEGLGAAPESVRDRHQKTFVPVRWEIVGGKPQLLAMSLDKVIANISRAVKDIVAAKQQAKIPYEVDASGKLTPAAWENVINDLQAYTENQSNGYRGDGQKLVRPTEDLQQSLPPENPGYNPTILPENKTNFLNLIQGLAPALTNREVTGRVPGSVKGAAIARAQGREPQVPSAIRPKDLTKQTYKSGERILETNPLRNELAAAGVPVRELIEVTERINAGDILSVKERPDLQFKAPVTDIIRGGFLPKESAKRPEPYEPLRDLAKSYSESSGVPYRPEGGYAELNPELSKRIADFYESAKSTPDDPKVQASYQALADETLNQYQTLVDAGYKIEPWTGEGEPYKSSADAIADVRNNKHLFVRPTENNFGAGTTQEQSHLLLRPSGIPELPTVNDVFRGVHDIFGHAKEGFQFGPRGELNAWRAHSEMYSPEAQGALAAETLAQNSWVNYGKHLRNEEGNVAQKGEPGYVELANRPFAEQKNLVVPDELIAEAKGTGQFLPKDQPVAEIAKELRDLDTAGLKDKFKQWGTSLTQAAYDVGRNVKSQADVSTLRALREEASAIARAAIKTGDFDAATPAAAKAQFWQEAIEAATGEGGKLDLIRGALKEPEFNPPFPTAKGEALPKSVPPVPSYFDVPGRKISAMDADMIQARGTPAKFWLNAKTGKILPASEGHVEVAKEILPNPPKEQAEIYDAMEKAGWVRGVNEGVGGIQLNGPELSRPAKITLDEIVATSRQPVRFNGEPTGRSPSAIEIARARGGEEPSGEFLPKKKKKEPSKPTSGWVLPDQEFVPLQQSYHEQYLAENSESLNKTFKTKFSNVADVEERLDALNAGFTRIRYEPNYRRMHIETNQKFWNKQKPGILDRLLKNPDSFDSVTISLLNNKGQVVDSQANTRLFESEDPAGDIQKLVDELRTRGSFLPSESEQTFKGFEPLSPEQRAKVMTKRKVNQTRESNPEAILPKYAREEDGSLSLTAEGKPRPVPVEYELANTPLAREAAKGKRGAERETAIANALGKELVGAYRQAEKNKDLLAGSTWYSTARVRLRKLFGDDAKFFAELLGATSARTPVETNFRFALDAYNRFKSGEYDTLLAKYREGKSLWDAGDIGDFVKATKNEDPTRGQFLDWWVDKHDLAPVQSNGKKFGANSRSVLRVLDGSWQSEVKGPKTPNFAGNLTGQTFEATVDIWAARALHRLANKGNEGRWRILPENETGVSDADFYLGQAAYRKAAEELGIKPDALQAVLWFAEKDLWEKRGWTRGAGALKSDFNTLLAETERTPEGLFRQKSTQSELTLEPKRKP